MGTVDSTLENLKVKETIGEVPDVIVLVQRQ